MFEAGRRLFKVSWVIFVLVFVFIFHNSSFIPFKFQKLGWIIEPVLNSLRMRGMLCCSGIH